MSSSVPVDQTDSQSAVSHANAGRDRPAPKSKKCRVCRREFLPRLTTQACCSMSCAITYAKLGGERRQSAAMKRCAEAERREQQASKREQLLKLLPMNGLYSLAQKAVNAFVRLRDRFKGCISCESGRVDDAGHLFPIGSKWRCHPLRLDPRLIHGQCRKCNSYTGGGNIHGYLAGLVQRYGQAYVDECYAIKNAAERGEIPLLTRDEVTATAAEFNRKARELRKAS